jgi:hypothetical protein
VVALIRTAGMRDLRGKRVFPRLLYLVALHEVDRLMHRLFSFFVGYPMARFRQFLTELETRRGTVDMVLSALSVLASLTRAYALLLLSLATLIAALTRF